MFLPEEGMNEYFREHDTSYAPAKEHFSQPVTRTSATKPLSQSKTPVDKGRGGFLAHSITQTSLPSSATACSAAPMPAVTTSAPHVGTVVTHNTSSSGLTSLILSQSTKSSTPISYAPHFNLPKTTPTAVAALSMQMHPSPRKLCGLVVRKLSLDAPVLPCCRSATNYIDIPLMNAFS